MKKILIMFIITFCLCFIGLNVYAIESKEVLPPIVDTDDDDDDANIVPVGDDQIEIEHKAKVARTSICVVIGVLAIAGGVIYIKKNSSNSKNELID